MLSQHLNNTINRAFALAKQQDAEYLCLEHLLLALLEEDNIENFLDKCGVDSQILKNEISSIPPEEPNIIPKENVPKFTDVNTQDPSDNEPHIELKSRSIEDEGNANEPMPTLGFQRTLQRAVARHQTSDRRVITTLDILNSLFDEHMSSSVLLLKKYDITLDKVVDFLDENLDYFEETEGDPRKREKTKTKATNNQNYGELIVLLANKIERLEAEIREIKKRLG